MKLSLAALLVCTTSVWAFAPLQTSNLPKTGPIFSEEMSLEEEVEEMVQEEVSNSKRMSNLRNERGIEYAPWMRMSAEDEENIRQTMRAKAEARRRRQEEAQDVQGELQRDFGFQELSGTGLRYKIVDGSNVELEWQTGEESNTKGFIVKRRAAKTQDFEVLASFENYGPLASQGTAGGVYRYYDENVPVGGWVYRVTECDVGGSQNDLSQCLVEVQSEEEQRAALFAAVAFGVAAIAAVVGGLALDPLQ